MIPPASNRHRFTPPPVVPSNGLVRLGWLHFWLLTAILGGMLALVALVLFAHRSV